ncbi:MAG: SGNH/GDSL hydrolase family protein [Treponema sp.]|nr:SGNH/GDSL hydrolase family protein [Treponema sp.]
MKVQIKTILTISAILLLSFFIFSCKELPRYYVALGDSVSAGFGLTSDEKNHPEIFFSFLENDGYVDYFANMAVSGFTTTMLLDLLNNLDNEELQILRNAQIVTLNIGGNNLIVPFVNYVSRFRPAPVSGDILSVIEDLVSRALRLLSNGFTSSFDEISSILRGSFSPELQSELDKGVRIFSEEFAEIIEWLNRKAPRATVIVNTIYNPIPQEVFGVSLEISNIVNMLIESMNNIIIQKSNTRGFIVTDLYSQLSYRLDMMIFNLNPFAGPMSLDIIHPNAAGQRLIAELNYETFRNSL